MMTSSPKRTPSLDGWQLRRDTHGRVESRVRFGRRDDLFAALLGACVALGAAHSAYDAGTSAPDQSTDDRTAISLQGVIIAFPWLAAGASRLVAECSDISLLGGVAIEAVSRPRSRFRQDCDRHFPGQPAACRQCRWYEYRAGTAARSTGKRDQER